MKPKSKQDIAKQLQNAQLHIVEKALIGFVEDIDGKVPTDAEILAHGFHVHFTATPLSVFEKDGKRFADYYVWRREHVVALGFIDPNHMLVLYIVRVPPDEWPVALKLFVAQKFNAPPEVPPST